MKRFYCSWWHTWHNELNIKSHDLQVWSTEFRDVKVENYKKEHFKDPNQSVMQAGEEWRYFAVIDEKDQYTVISKLRWHYPGCEIDMVKEVDRDFIPEDRHDMFENKTLFKRLIVT